MKRILLYIFLFTIAVHGQDTTKLSVKRSEFDKIKKEIKDLEEELKQKNQSEKKSIKVIENLNKQNLLINKVISTLRIEEKKRADEISKIEKNITDITQEINSLKKSYARYLVYLYKYGKDYEWFSIVNSKSFNQALIKYKYFNKISEKRKRDLFKLKEDKNQLDILRSGLVKESAAQKIITDQKLNEEEVLKTKLTERQEVLKNLKNDKISLAEEIELKKKASVEIKNMITQLIIEERKKAEEIRRQKEIAEKKRIEEEKNKQKTQEEQPAKNYSITNVKETPVNNSAITTSTVNASETSLFKKGSLLWPIENGSVFKKFGETKNPRLNTVTINYGIDIKAGNSLDVKSVADGSVSVINWVPGYGSVLIITHKNGFRSVYGHLSEIYVSEGEVIHTGTTLGKIGESLEGNILHFELWIDRNNQNPEVWLARK